MYWVKYGEMDTMTTKKKTKEKQYDYSNPNGFHTDNLRYIKCNPSRLNSVCNYHWFTIGDSKDSEGVRHIEVTESLLDKTNRTYKNYEICLGYDGSFSLTIGVTADNQHPTDFFCPEDMPNDYCVHRAIVNALNWLFKKHIIYFSGINELEGRSREIRSILNHDIFLNVPVERFCSEYDWSEYHFIDETDENYIDSGLVAVFCKTMSLYDPNIGCFTFRAILSIGLFDDMSLGIDFNIGQNEKANVLETYKFLRWAIDNQIIRIREDDEPMPKYDPWNFKEHGAKTKKDEEAEEPLDKVKILNKYLWEVTKEPENDVGDFTYTIKTAYGLQLAQCTSDWQFDDYYNIVQEHNYTLLAAESNYFITDRTVNLGKGNL